MINALLERLFGPRVASRLSPWLTLLALGVATFLLGRLFNAQAKLESWLFWRYALVWLCVLVFVAACLSSGNWLVTRLSSPEERGLGHFTLSFASGVYCFYLLTTLLGFLRLLDGVSFVLIPLLLFALGARELLTEVKTWRQRSAQDPGWLGLTPTDAIGLALGALAVAVIYLGVLVPDNAAYDTRWYHLGLADHYAAAGGIIRSPEGAATAAVPHLASILYTWAFCLPGAGLFEHVELAAHLELIAFVMTLPGIVALVRLLVPGARARSAWLWIFAFPSIFLYDSSLHGAADHVAALWTIPAYLALARALKDLRPSACALLAIQLSGLLMSKYTAVLAVAGPALVLVARGVFLALRQALQKPRQTRALLGLAVTLGVGLLLTSPHWLKNWVWHGDPLYPALHHYLHVRPWSSDAPFLFAVYSLADSFAASGTLAQRLLLAGRALYDYSFALYTWADFHGSYPVFGSLFTFSLLALPFLKGARRVWGLVLVTHLGIVVWALTIHAERYLQTLLPWMAASVAATFVLAWRSGWPARVGVVALAGLQLIWGLDMPFWSLHRMTGKSSVGLANDFFARGYGNAGAARVKPFEEYAALGRDLPKTAKVLVHHEHLHTGLGTMTVTDSTRIQYGLNYGELGSTRALHRLLKEYGVTHVMWEPGLAYGDETMAGDLVFHAYAQTWEALKDFGSRRIARLPSAEPPDYQPSALVYVCDGTYAPGRYRLADLRVSPYVLPGVAKTYPAPRVALADETWPVGYAVVNDRCAGAPKLKGYKQVAAIGTTRYFVSQR